jgi:hypothetical protein
MRVKWGQTRTDHGFRFGGHRIIVVRPRYTIGPLPEAGTRYGTSARQDPCGACRVTGIPAATARNNMSKTTITYWNPLNPDNSAQWQPIDRLRGMAEELTLSIDVETGEYTRLTRFHPGADTTPFGGKSHPYPEEVLVVSGRLYDQAFDMWLEAGHYASRPPGEIHGPFRTDVGCVVLELSFPNRVT